MELVAPIVLCSKYFLHSILEAMGDWVFLEHLASTSDDVSPFDRTSPLWMMITYHTVGIVLYPYEIH